MPSPCIATYAVEIAVSNSHTSAGHNDLSPAGLLSFMLLVLPAILCTQGLGGSKEEKQRTRNIRGNKNRIKKMEINIPHYGLTSVRPELTEYSAHVSYCTKRGDPNLSSGVLRSERVVICIMAKYSGHCDPLGVAWSVSSFDLCTPALMARMLNLDVNFISSSST